MASGAALQADASLLLAHSFRDGESCASVHESQNNRHDNNTAIP
jgi:hypothetical protein